MADLDTLRIRGIPFRALVDGAGVAVSGTDTIRDLKDEGMEPICEVDETGAGVVGSETAATLRNRGIPVFCEVGEDGLASSGHTLPQLRDRGILGLAIVGLDGIAQGGSLTIAQLRERGIASFCPVDEDGLETGLATARMTLVGRTIPENSANGTTIGTLGTVNTTGTAAFTLTDTAGGRFSLTGALLKVANGTLLDYETNTSHNITVSVTGVTPTIANRTFLILVTDVDDTAPTITSSNAISIAENTTLSHTLTADETVTWTKTGGADTAQFTLTGNVLSWATTSTRDFEAPADADLNNTYVVQVTATDAASNATNQTITFTVTDVTGVAPAAPVLDLTSDVEDLTPDFTLTGDLALDDVVRFQYSTASDFTGASEITNTIDSAEDAANTLSFSTGALAVNTWYFRARIERGEGISGWSNTETITLEGGYDVATEAWIAAVVGGGGTVSTTQADRVDALIVSLKADGLFSANSRLWIHAGESVAKQATIDLMGLGVATLPVAPTLSAQGYTGNGTTQYINYGTLPSNHVQDSCSYGAYNLLNSTTTNNEVIIGRFGNTRFMDLIPRQSGSGALIRLNGSLMVGGNANRRGLFIGSRRGATDEEFYINGVSVATGSSTSNDPDTIAYFGLGRNDAGTATSFSADIISIAWIGPGLTDTQAINLSTHINTYMTAWGINVY